MRYLLLFGVCFMPLCVVHLNGEDENVEPPRIQVTIDGPDAALLGNTVHFTAHVSKTGQGGSDTYAFAWRVDGVLEEETGNTCSYTVPSGPAHAKEVTVTCTATDVTDPSITDTASKKFWQVRFDLDVDATYDGTIDDADENLETTQGGLIAFNGDDDNRNGTADLNETTVASEDDLCRVPVVLAPQNISGSSLTLSATAGGGKIRAWLSSTKSGTPFTLPHTWQAGAQPECVYVEGIQTSGARCDIGLRLAFTKGNTTLNDEIALGVVKVVFTNRSDTAYGFDDGSRAYPTPNPADYTPQKYSWASVPHENGTTKVNAQITPPAYANSVFFTVDDTSKAACSPVRATASPQLLTLTGKGIAPKSETFVRANLGSASGPLASRLNVAIYQPARLGNRDNIIFYKIRTATLIPDGTTWGQLTNGANALLARGVAYLDGQDGGTKLIEYDLNTNGVLDYVAGGGGPEWQAVLNGLMPQSGYKYVLHIAPCIRCDGTDATGLYLSYLVPRCDFIIITDASSSKTVTLAHETLHALKLEDVGPAGRNTLNIMYYQSSANKRDLGYFPVQRHGKPGTENQWETIYRGY